MPIVSDSKTPGYALRGRTGVQADLHVPMRSTSGHESHRTAPRSRTVGGCTVLPMSSPIPVGMRGRQHRSTETGQEVLHGRS